MANDSFNYDSKAVRSHMLKTWLQTILGVGLIASLTGLMLYLFGISFTWITILMLFWIALPVYGWYNGTELVKKAMHCHSPMPDDPEHERFVRIVDEVLPHTGLKVRPEVLISPIPVPNAFATGRSPSNSVIAATEGLFMVGLNDEEIRAIVAHELAHIKSRDVTITTFMAVLGSFFAILVALGIPGLFASVYSKNKSQRLLEKLEDKTKRKKRFFATGSGLASLVLLVAVFIVANFFAKLILLFVTRARESHADALAISWTKDPCALSSALQKISLWMNMNMFDIRLRLLLGGLSPMLFMSIFEDEDFTSPPERTFSARLRRWWQRVGNQHPPVPDRLKALDKFSGAKCPRLA